MAKISGPTFFLKRVFPAVWFGFLAVFVAIAIANAVLEGPEPAHLFLLAVPLMLAAFGYALMRQIIWDLADEVFDHGDHLVVRARGAESRIELADVMNVSYTPMNPPRITLRLRTPGRFGRDVPFTPIPSPLRTRIFRPFATNPIAEDLMVRVDRARVNQAR
jgi:hypothetical protein